MKTQLSECSNELYKCESKNGVLTAELTRLQSQVSSQELQLHENHTALAEAREQIALLDSINRQLRLDLEAKVSQASEETDHSAQSELESRVKELQDLNMSMFFEH